MSRPYFRNFHVTINDLLIDPAQSKVAIWAKSTGETDIGEYANEYMLIFYMDESGEKVIRSLVSWIFLPSSKSVLWI